MLRPAFVVFVSACYMPAQTVFFNVDVFDGYRMLRRQTVTVRAGMIRDVRPSGLRPAGAVVDSAGYTLLPGLIDAHCHVSTEGSLEQAAALGVTTELDMFGYPDQLIPLRAAVHKGEHPNAADFRTAGIGANAPGGHPSEMGGPPFPALGPHDDAQKFVDARLAEGSDYLKILYDHTMPGLTVEQLRDLVVAAHKRNKLVAVHETVQKDGLEAIQAGADEIEHIFDDTPISREFIDAAVNDHITITPTLAIISALGDTLRERISPAVPRLRFICWVGQRGSLIRSCRRRSCKGTIMKTRRRP